MPLLQAGLTINGRCCLTLEVLTLCILTLGALQVLSLVDEHGVESIRPGAYTLRFGVEGGTEGTPETVQLQLESAQQVIFDMPAARARDEVSSHLIATVPV